MTTVAVIQPRRATTTEKQKEIPQRKVWTSMGELSLSRTRREHDAVTESGNTKLGNHPNMEACYVLMSGPHVGGRPGPRRTGIFFRN